MLQKQQHENLLANIGFDIAENEPSKIGVISTPPPNLPGKKNIYGYRLLVRVLRGGVVLNVLRGVLVVDLSRGYRREQFSGALADGKPERGGLNHGAHISRRAVSVLL